MGRIWLILSLVLFFLSPVTVFAEEKEGKNQLLIINKRTNKMAFYEGGELIRIYDVATGKKPSYTPEGRFKIVNKIKNRPYYKEKIPGGDPRNPLGDRWLGLNAGGTWGTTYGIHGNNNENSIGKYVSKGCVRMHNDEIRQLFERVELYTPVIIVNSKKTFDEIALANGYELLAGKALPFETKLTTFETLRLYKSPGVPDRYSIAPQTVQAFERKGNWYHIRTWVGDRWIYTKNGLPGEAVATDEQIELRGITPVYTQPTQSGDLLTTLAPQTVTAFERWGDWLHIHTWKGDGWVRVEKDKLDQNELFHPGGHGSDGRCGEFGDRTGFDLGAFDAPKKMNIILEVYEKRGAAPLFL